MGPLCAGHGLWSLPMVANGPHARGHYANQGQSSQCPSVESLHFRVFLKCKRLTFQQIIRQL